MNITIAGYGFVGQAHHAVLKNYHRIEIVDPAYPEYSQYIPKDSDALIVCVSTPAHETGACNVNNVYDVISKTRSDVPILIKSTISLEGWDVIRLEFPKHSLTFSPEFLRAATAVEDFKNTKQLLMGGDDVDFWSRLLIQALGNDVVVDRVNVEELILAKYFRNSFLATKVAFFNQMYDMCKTIGVDYKTVAAVVGEDSRIGHSHTTVTTERGFGGHCFPKDTQAIVNTSKFYDAKLTIIEEAINYNNSIRKETD